MSVATRDQIEFSMMLYAVLLDAAEQGLDFRHHGTIWFCAGLFASLLPRIECSEMKGKVALQRRMANNATLKKRGGLVNGI
ncbi:MAG: hypothetical protein IH948_01115 [Bacteroidetes bacterium]|nr:hypothetical protein [Bacteroidota bacterium]